MTQVQFKIVYKSFKSLFSSVRLPDRASYQFAQFSSWQGGQVPPFGSFSSVHSVQCTNPPGSDCSTLSLTLFSVKRHCSVFVVQCSRTRQGLLSSDRTMFIYLNTTYLYSLFIALISWVGAKKLFVQLDEASSNLINFLNPSKIKQDAMRATKTVYVSINKSTA